MRTLQGVFSFIRVVRVPLAVSILCAIAFSIPMQTIEIYRSIAQSVSLGFLDSGERFWEGVAGLVSVVILGLAIWVATQWALSRKWLVCPPRIRATACALIAVAPLLGASYGVYRAIPPAASPEVFAAAKLALADIVMAATGHVPPDSELEKAATMILDYKKVLTWGWSTLLALAVALFFSLSLLGRSARVQAFAARLAANRRAALYVSGAALIVLILMPPQPIITLGTLTIFCVFAVLVLFILTAAALFADRTRIPVIGALVFYVAVLSLLGWNDNHRAFTLPDKAASAKGAAEIQKDAKPPTLDTAFLAWLNSRPDQDTFKNERYPVYIVAAQGGGIYAAAHTALVLGGLQDNCPSFAAHTFAVSGVSGGSVGSALFGTVLKAAGSTSSDALNNTSCSTPQLGPDKKEWPINLVQISDRVLSHDLLSPVVYGLLFSDFAQLFIPARNVFTDRARQFELALEANTRRGLDDELISLGRARVDSLAMASSYYDYWSPTDTWPALLLNTTEVGSGRRRVISPFDFSSDDAQILPIFQGPLKRLPLSTASVLSARFPWVTPPGWYDQEFETPPPKAGETSKTYENQLVDGGYFENSGVATALDLIRAIQRIPGVKDRTSIRLIVLTRADYENDTFFGTESASAPVRALLNARSARGVMSVKGAQRELADQLAEPSKLGPLLVRQVYLRDMDYPPALGWRLSKVTGFLIQAQNARPDGCSLESGFGKPIAGRFDADCVLSLLRHDLDRKKALGAALP